MSMLTANCKFYRSPAHIVSHHNVCMALKDRIREARTSAGLNKSALARMCGVDPSAINKLESGDTKTISGDLLLKVSSATGIDPFVIGEVPHKPVFVHEASPKQEDPLTVDLAIEKLVALLKAETPAKAKFTLAHLDYEMEKSHGSAPPQEQRTPKARSSR